MLRTPATPGDYPIPVPAGQPPMLRHWNGKAWSAPWYLGDPEACAATARATPMRKEPARITRALDRHATR